MIKHFLFKTWLGEWLLSLIEHRLGLMVADVSDVEGDTFALGQGVAQ